MNYKMLVVSIPLLLLTVVSASSAIEVNPENIDEIVFGSKTVSVEIFNDKNVTLSIYITTNIPEYVTINPTELEIDANSTETVTLTLHAGDYSGRITYHYEYTIDNSTTTGDIEQNVTVQYGKITISPAKIDVDVIEGEDYETHVTVTNFLDYNIRVSIDYSGVVKDASDDDFVLFPDTSKTLKITLEGKSGTGEIEYTFLMEGATHKEVQNVTVNAYKPEEIEEYERIVNEVYLPDEIIVSVGGGKVGEPLTVTVKGKVNGSEIVLKNVPVKFGDMVKFTDSSGKVTFTPTSAGTYTITVLDRFGNTKVEKSLTITKSEYKFTISDKNVGERITIELPEEGTVKIFKNGELQTTLTGDKVEYSPSDVGVYKIEYDSNSYYGSTTFKVKGKVSVRISNQGGANAQNVVYAGDTVTFKFEYDNGKSVNNLDVIVAMPATAFGFDRNTAMMMALADPTKFTPPFNINTQSKVTGGVLMVSIPEEADGVLILKVPDNDLISGGTYTFKIEERPFDYVPYIIGAVIIGGVGGFGIVLAKNVGGVRDRLGSLRTRGGEPPV